jgi:hypothetical protein
MTARPHDMCAHSRVFKERLLRLAQVGRQSIPCSGKKLGVSQPAQTMQKGGDDALSMSTFPAILFQKLCQQVALHRGMACQLLQIKFGRQGPDLTVAKKAFKS